MNKTRRVILTFGMLFLLFLFATLGCLIGYILTEEKCDDKPDDCDEIAVEYLFIGMISAGVFAGAFFLLTIVVAIAC